MVRSFGAFKWLAKSGSKIHLSNQTLKTPGNFISSFSLAKIMGPISIPVWVKLFLTESLLFLCSADVAVWASCNPKKEPKKVSSALYTAYSWSRDSRNTWKKNRRKYMINSPAFFWKDVLVAKYRHYHNFLKTLTFKRPSIIINKLNRELNCPMILKLMRESRIFSRERGGGVLNNFGNSFDLIHVNQIFRALPEDPILTKNCAP